ncbi:hypothetical protein Cgig2_004083 [Carnegiea gigantea]|uniref:Uncharacterized protein n=1 Tax=Carnegiea gigantea TaxID=171969 RepID=A0A9Q1KUA5_9CARY|nr:hypothetical protein Cgig2_004083 [Carnegiea gigantea]
MQAEFKLASGSHEPGKSSRGSALLKLEPRLGSLIGYRMLKLGRNSVQHGFLNASFRWIFAYTTSAINAGSSDFTIEYLVNSLGFSKEEAIVASSKVSRLKSSEKPDYVVNLLKTSGFNEAQIKKIVSSVPKILTYDVDKTLKPKLEAFQELGLYGSELADVISVHPGIFVRASERNILRTLAVLKSVFEDKFIMLEALRKPSWMLASAIPKTVPPHVALLKSYGLSMDQIKLMFLRKSKFFTMEPKWLQAILIRVEEKLGIPRDSPMFLHGICAFGSMSEETLESKLKIFRSFRWSEPDILTLARKNPYSLSSSESKLRRHLNFLMKDLGHQPAEIASFGSVFNLSFERRVIPRTAVLKVLKEKRLVRTNCRVLSSLKLTEQQFINKFVLPFKDEVLDLYTGYTRRADSASKTGE